MREESISLKLFSICDHKRSLESLQIPYVLHRYVPAPNPKSYVQYKQDLLSNSIKKIAHIYSIPHTHVFVCMCIPCQV